VDEPTVIVGKITKAHGLKGELAVLSLSDNPQRFVEGNVVFLQDGRALTIREVRANGARLLVTFDGVADRTAAEALGGAMLVVPEAELPDLPDGTYWPHQLEGCEVVTRAGRSFGTITEVVANPANDIWIATGPAGEETLVPAIRQVIAEVDIRARRVIVNEVPGITAAEE
jgi:16S rRNA processing protein RimM